MMNVQTQLFENLPGAGNPSDVVYTPRSVAKQIIDWCQPYGQCLDPCRGDGAFYEQMPPSTDTDWCEIEKGRDFFQYSNSVDWIVSNPPYSIYRQWLSHSFAVADNVVYLIPISKAFASTESVRMTQRYGGIKSIFILGAGRNVCPGFDYGYAVGAVHYQRNYRSQNIKLEYAIQC